MPQGNQARATNYKYTQNMRNPPTQNVALGAQQPAVQAVHVKGKAQIVKCKINAHSSMYNRFSNCYRPRAIDRFNVGSCPTS